MNTLSIRCDVNLLEKLHLLREVKRMDGHEVSRIVLPPEEHKRLRTEYSLPVYKDRLLMDGTPVVSGDVDEVAVKTEGFVQS